MTWLGSGCGRWTDGRPDAPDHVRRGADDCRREGARPSRDPRHGGRAVREGGHAPRRHGGEAPADRVGGHGGRLRGTRARGLRVGRLHEDHAGEGMTPYARGTEVPVDRSKAELEKLLNKYGASRFLSGWE